MMRAFDIGVARRIGRYADAVLLHAPSQLLFVSGTPGLRADGSLPDDVEEQSRQAWANVLAILAEAEMRPEHIVKVTQTLVRAEDIPVYARVRGEALGEHRPASMLNVATQLVRPDFLVEIEVYAAR